MNERDLKPVEALLRVAPTGRVRDIWPYHEPFYRQPAKKRAKPKAVESLKNKAHPTPDHIGEKIDFDV